MDLGVSLSLSLSVSFLFRNFLSFLSFDQFYIGSIADLYWNLIKCPT